VYVARDMGSSASNEYEGVGVAEVSLEEGDVFDEDIENTDVVDDDDDDEEEEREEEEDPAAEEEEHRDTGERYVKFDVFSSGCRTSNPTFVDRGFFVAGVAVSSEAFSESAICRSDFRIPYEKA